MFVITQLDVECGEEQVLQNGLVVAVTVWLQRRFLQEAAERLRVEQPLGHEALLLDEPDEDQAREQADDGDGLKAFVVFRRGRRKLHLRAGPEVPMRQLGVELLVEFLHRQCAQPRVIQLAEVAGSLGALAQGVGGQRGQDTQVRGMRLTAADVLDDRDAVGHHIARRVALVGPPVNHCDRKPTTVAEHHDGGHGESAVQLTRDARQSTARPVFAIKRQAKEDKRLELLRVHRCGGAETALSEHERRNFVVGELEQEVRAAPLRHFGTGIVEGGRCLAELAQSGHEISRPATEVDGLVAAVAQRFQQPGCGERQWLLVEGI